MLRQSSELREVKAVGMGLDMQGDKVPEERAAQRVGSGDQQKVSSRLLLSNDLYMRKFSLQKARGKNSKAIE